MEYNKYLCSLINFDFFKIGLCNEEKRKIVEYFELQMCINLHGFTEVLSRSIDQTDTDRIVVKYMVDSTI